MSYHTEQYGVVPRVMATASVIGRAGELMVSYCNGVRCLVMHDGVTQGGCWRICVGGGHPGGGMTCEEVIACLEGWTAPVDGCLLEGWEVTKGTGQNADDNILTLTFTNCDPMVIPLPDDDGVVDVTWSEEDRTLTITKDDGTTTQYVIGDKFARLNEAGDVIIFPDGRTWEHCCADHYVGTCGCDYPTSPAEGDYHLNGGALGCLQQYDGENWINVNGIRQGDTFYCTETNRDYQASGPCSWTETTDSFCLLANVPEIIDPDNWVFAVENCIEDPCECEGDPNCECRCDDYRSAKRKITLSQLTEIINANFDLCLENVPEFDGCSVTEYAVFEHTPEGCMRLGIKSAAAKQSYSGDAGRGDVNQALNGEFVWPGDFTDPATVSEIATTDAPGGIGGSGVPEALVEDNIVANASFTLPCHVSFDLNMNFAVLVEASLDAFTSAASATYRWRVNGGTWQWARSNNSFGTDAISFFRFFNGVVPTASRNAVVNLPAGNIEFQIILAPNSANVTDVIIHTYNNGQVATPNFQLSPQPDI